MASRLVRQVIAVSLAGLLQVSGAGASDPIRIDGSSTVYPLTNALAAAYRSQRQGTAPVSVGISGTGGGFRKFCRGEIDISDASRPINTQEMADCRTARIEYVELPVAFDAITIVVHPSNQFLQSVTVAELRRLWEPAAQGKVLRWNQVNPAWPNQPVKLFAPGRDSGTFDYFTEAVVGQARASRGDLGQSEDDNVIARWVSRSANSLAYFGISYYLENAGRVRAVAVADDNRPPVMPSLDTVLDGTYRPLSRPVFIYVSATALKRPEVREFAEFYLREAARTAREVQSVPLPMRAYVAGLDYLRNNRFGTVFGGNSQIGITIDELMKREAQR